MKRSHNIFMILFTGILFTVPSNSINAGKNARNTQLSAIAEANFIMQDSIYDQFNASTQEPVNINETSSTEMNSAKEEVIVSTEPKPILSVASETTNQPKQTSDKTVALSRGVAPAVQSQSSEKTKTELLDWWKEAQYVFSRDDIATVKDVYTGKTFKVKRTMGTNHADSEALTLTDTEIIKSIWGGFSWDRRPVHIYIKGRVLAASMSAMPHAGLDSAPAYAYVNNRSDGYGSGENLDVIKNNGMDGHFDIHFLNSTRHKDGKLDPEHQKMIKIAAEK
jgi:hypothetical protein